MRLVFKNFPEKIFNGAGINRIQPPLSDGRGAWTMSAASEFEWKETYRARLNGLESVLAALIDQLMAQDAKLGGELSCRLASLEVLMREQNAHFASLKTVHRFQGLVEDETQESDDPCSASVNAKKICICGV